MSECKHGQLARSCYICELKQSFADLEKRISVAVNIHKGRKQFVDNNLDWEAVLTMSQSDFDKFCQKHPEFLP